MKRVYAEVHTVLSSLEKLVLAGGAKVDDLSQEPELLSRLVRVSGKLHPSHADKPPGLTVEAWETAETP